MLPLSIADVQKRREFVSMEQLSLARQIDIVFKQLREELAQLKSGIVYVQIRNNVIGKFGVRHDPIESKDGKVSRVGAGLSEAQQISLRNMAIESLCLKKNWTHGEIQFEFALKNNRLVTSVQFESNYNMSNLLPRFRRAGIQT